MPESSKNSAALPRRRVLEAAAAAPLALALPGRALAATGRPIKIGFVSPRTGPLAAFGEGDAYVIGEMRRVLANGITVNGVQHPVVIIDKDSQSSANRAAEIASALIKSDKVDLMMAASTSETVNPVADQCEINRVPCITTDNPWQAYFFGRGGRPDKGFKYTYHFFWGQEDAIAVFTSLWDSVPSNKVVAAIWPNDPEGISFGDAKTGFPAALAAKGYKVIDPGRINPAATDYSAQISRFKAEKAEILTGVFTPPAFATFWNQAAQQGFKPKVCTVAKACLFPAAVAALGERAYGVSTEVWWGPGSPFKSSLTGATAAAYCDAYTASTGKPWIQPLGFRHALFEVAVDVFKRTTSIDDREAVMAAIRATNAQTIVGPVNWGNGPVKNVVRTPLVGGQWTRGQRFQYDLKIVNNDNAKQVPVQAPLALLT
jgi:branched-chain amino acid transport system substrate-binding protein